MYPSHPTFQDWEKIRPHFTRLYMTENKKLSDVRLALLHDYGFKATLRMYKSRILQWGLFKYKTGPSHTAPSSGSSNDDEIEEVVPELYHPMDQPSTHGVSEAPHDSLPDQLLVSSSLTRDEDEDYDHYYEWRPLSLPWGSGSVEATLQYTRVYLDWALQQEVDTEAAEPIQFAYNLQDLQGGPQGLDGAVATKESIWYKFHYGVGLLERGHYHYAFNVLDAGCSTVFRFLKKPPRLFFQSLIMVLGSERWSRFRPIQLHLLTFLGTMASKVIGPAHPITLMLQQLANDNMIEQTAEVMLRRTLHAFEKALGTGTPEVLRLKRTLGTILQRQNDHMPCEAVLRTACADSEMKLGLDHVETRRCLRRLSYLYMKLGRYYETVSICETVISRQTELAHGADPDEFTICTYQNLAVANECIGNHEESEEWLLKSVIGAWRKWGLHGAYSFEDFDGLKDMVYIENNKKRGCLEDAAHHQDMLRKVRTRILDKHILARECVDCGPNQCDSHSHLARIAENRF